MFFKSQNSLTVTKMSWQWIMNSRRPELRQRKLASQVHAVKSLHDA